MADDEIEAPVPRITQILQTTARRCSNGAAHFSRAARGCAKRGRMRGTNDEHRIPVAGFWEREAHSLLALYDSISAISSARSGD